MIAGTSFHLAEIDEVWGSVAKRLESLTIDDPRDACRSGDAACLACADGIVVIDLRHVTGGLQAFVLLAASDGKPWAFKAHEAELMTIARDMGAKELAFEPARGGWGRLLGPEWERRGVMYVRGV